MPAGWVRKSNTFLRKRCLLSSHINGRATFASSKISSSGALSSLRAACCTPPLASLKSAAEAGSLGAITLEDAERDHIRKTLEQTGWGVDSPNGAAARLGMKRSTLYFRMQKLGISRTKRDLLPT